MMKKITKEDQYGVMNEHLPNQLEADYIVFIKTRFGIVVKKNNMELYKAIQTACDKYHFTPAEYLNELKKSKDNSEILVNLVSAITVGETYFFRDKQQTNVLIEKVIPGIINRKKSKNDYTLRIWSAGCSSGEEIYTIVMLFNDVLKTFDNWQYHFLATDINIDALKKGMSGKYTKWSMRAIPEYYLKKYFTEGDNGYEISEEIKKYVTFDYLNLNSDNYPSLMNGTTAHDLVICRNVLIYFDDDHIKHILNKLSNCIAEDGFIMLGASDPVCFTDKNIVSGELPSLFIKNEGSSKSLVDDKPQVSGVNHITHSPISLNQSKAKTSDDILNELIAESKWSDVIAVVNQSELITPSTPSYLIAKAMALANIGKTTEAIKACEDCLKLDKLNKEAYFIYALSLAESKKWQQAEAAFKKALYIDPNFLICRYQFGLFLIHLKKYAEGIKSIQNTINSAEQFNPDAMVPHYQNITYKELISMLKNEINLYR